MLQKCGRSHWSPQHGQGSSGRGSDQPILWAVAGNKWECRATTGQRAEPVRKRDRTYNILKRKSMHNLQDNHVEVSCFGVFLFVSEHWDILRLFCPTIWNQFRMKLTVCCPDLQHPCRRAALGRWLGSNGCWWWVCWIPRVNVFIHFHTFSWLDPGFRDENAGKSVNFQSLWSFYL